MKRGFLFGGVPAGVALTALIFHLGSGNPRQSLEAGRPAAIDPDYAGVTIPPGVAPLNLRILEPGTSYTLRISSGDEPPLEISSSDGKMRIPEGAWRKLVSKPGGELRMDILAKQDGRWIHLNTIRDPIAADAIDPYVVYRYIPAIYNKWDKIQLIQRSLGSFEERVVLDTSTIRRGTRGAGTCVHCHTFQNHGTARMWIETRPGDRSNEAPSAILVENGHARRVDTRTGGGPPAAYSSFSPDGKLVAFSRNKIAQMFHTSGEEPREVIDANSDLALYEVDTGRVFTVPQISTPGRLETFPAWSADGRYLYFTSAPAWTDPKHPSPVGYDKVQYDLDRVSYDPASGKWGEVETLVAASKLNKSISEPAPSPDGRYVLFCVSDYGSFPVFQPSSDLYLLDLQQGRTRRLDEIDSDRSDSYHSWSSNGRWVIFASKRDDGVYGRLYLSHFDGQGSFSKPFVLPQEDPGFYGRCLMTFNRPELLREAVTVSQDELKRAIESK